MSVPTLHTARLILRPWRADEAQAWITLTNEPGILRYFPNPKLPGMERAQAYLARHEIGWRERGYGHWALTLPGNDSPLGWCGFEYIPELDQTELAYLLATRMQGRGLATEASQAALEFAWEHTDLQEIIGLVHRDNTPSVRVLLKCGMHFADTLQLWGMELQRYSIHRSA